MRRPVWEPPEIDMIGKFGTKEMMDWLKDIKMHIPHPTQRADYLDLWSEYQALLEYRNWTSDAGRAALACGDRSKEKFYERLIETTRRDVIEVWDEYSLKHQEVFSETLKDEWEDERTQEFRFRDENGTLLEYMVVFTTQGSATLPLETSGTDAIEQPPVQALSSPSPSKLDAFQDTNSHTEAPSALPDRKRPSCCVLL